ncbi:hypothetical protein GGR12_001201 [Brevundimonas lenta]|uniref:Uncharacterized protein n=1 Tax=Brevundimonas lenta TaxID=424796 RepID=A0A7W6JDY3_9CAUL|nr:hypothetical protein [Brevundimonas lenta]
MVPHSLAVRPEPEPSQALTFCYALDLAFPDPSG